MSGAFMGASAVLGGPVDAGTFRAAMANHAASVAVLTVNDGESVRGVTLSSLISLSLDPALVLFALRRGSSMLPSLHRGLFGLTVLGDSQHAIAQALARKDRPGVARGVAPGRRCRRVATIAEGAVQMTASVFQRWDVGDHVCIAARVVAASRTDRNPLLHHRGAFAGVRQARCVTAIAGWVRSPDQCAGSNGANAGATHIAVSSEGRQLFALAPRAPQVVAYRVDHDGSLTNLGFIAVPVGSVGLAAR